MKKKVICMLMLCCMLFYNNMIKISASNDRMRVYSKDDIETIQSNNTMPHIPLDSVQPRMIITVSVGVGLEIEGNKAICDAIVLGVSTEVKEIKIIMHLQKQRSDGSYYDITKWETTKSGIVHSIEKQYPLVSRGIYRVQADAYVYDFDNNCELNFFYSYDEYY